MRNEELVDYYNVDERGPSSRSRGERRRELRGYKAERNNRRLWAVRG